MMIFDYEIAKFQGYKGTFADFMSAHRIKEDNENIIYSFAEIQQQGVNAAQAFPTLQRLKQLSEQFADGVTSEYRKRYAALIATLGFKSNDDKGIQEYVADLAQYLIERKKELGRNLQLSQSVTSVIRQVRAGCELSFESHQELLDECIRATNILIERQEISEKWQHQTGVEFTEFHDKHVHYGMKSNEVTPPELPEDATPNGDGTYTLSDGTRIAKKH